MGQRPIVEVAQGLGVLPVEVGRKIALARVQIDAFRECATSGSQYNWARLRKLALDFCGTSRHVHWLIVEHACDDEQAVEATFVIHEFVSIAQALLDTAGEEPRTPQVAAGHIRAAVDQSMKRIQIIEDFRQRQKEFIRRLP